MSFFAFYFKESPTYLSAAKEPNSLVHDDKDSGDDNPNSPYSLMIGEHLYRKGGYFHGSKISLKGLKIRCICLVIRKFHALLVCVIQFEWE